MKILIEFDEKKIFIYSFLANEKYNGDNIINIEDKKIYTFSYLCKKLFNDLEKFKKIFQKDKEKDTDEQVNKNIYNNIFSDNFMYTYFQIHKKFLNQNFSNIIFNFIKENEDDTIQIINKIFTSENNFMNQLKKINIINANTIVNNKNFSFDEKEDNEDYKKFIIVHDCINLMKEKIFNCFKTFLIT